MDSKFHFIGIGGIGMSALARVLLQKGQKVRGSDVGQGAVLNMLRREGADIYETHSPEGLEGTTVVYSTDIPLHNVELARAKELRCRILHRSEMLDLLLREKKPLLVTGTHGKTTTTALLAEVLLEGSFDPSFVVGGILQSLQTNGRNGSGSYFVAEADESDGSFLKTPSFGAIVTNCENEHMNYWRSNENLHKAFRQFFSQVKHEEYLFWCADDPCLFSLAPPGNSYGFSQKADVLISSYRQEDQGIVFDLTFHEKTYPDIALSLFGHHNALNGAAVFALALSLGVLEADIRRAFEKFKGTKRRLEWLGEVNCVQIYDDYGHHPTEIAVTLRALKARIGKKRLVAVFQPHRFTRVRDLWDQFFHCFSDADVVVLTDIYSAGESTIPGVSSEFLYARLREKLGDKVFFFSRLELEQNLSSMLKSEDVVLTLGAGDVTKVGRVLLQK